MAINMQLSSSLARARLSLALRWRPRDENVEADQLTNEDYTGFEPKLRVVLVLDDLDLSVLNSLVKSRSDFEVSREKARAEAKCEVGRTKRRVDKTPWQCWLHFSFCASPKVGDVL